MSGTSNGGVVNVSGSTITIPLTNVADAQTLTVALNSVTDGPPRAASRSRLAS
jgi:hypothetical protein